MQLLSVSWQPSFAATTWVRPEQGFVLWSILPIFYTQLIRRYSFTRKSTNLKCKLKKAAQKTFAQKLHVKCWWNWHLNSRRSPWWHSPPVCEAIFHPRAGQGSRKERKRSWQFHFVHKIAWNENFSNCTRTHPIKWILSLKLTLNFEF